MAKRKRKGGRRRAKPGIGQLAVGAAVIAELSNGQFLKNKLTDNIRDTMHSTMPNIGGHDGRAVLFAMGYEFVRHEANKLHVNPSYGPVRLL